jgi:hypothetical protein
MINKIQELNLHLIEQASFNGFDGEKVGADLRKYQDLWEGVIMGRFDNYVELVSLRDIADGYWNVDTIVIIPKKGKEAELEILAKTWNADEVGYDESYRSKLGGGKDSRVLRVWWD